MAVAIRPSQGGFLRPFGAAWFIIEFLKGNGPEESTIIDPAEGSPMTDIHGEYKSALHRAHARDAAVRDEEERARREKRRISPERIEERTEYYLGRIPYKLTKMRYASFTRYFGHLKRLGWVEETGRTEASAIQDNYPPAPSRVYYRLTDAGMRASMAEVSNPVRMLYPQFDSAYAKTKRKLHQYARY